MRKRYRAPGGKTCPLCHPEKTGHDRRWTAKEEVGLRTFEVARAQTRFADWRYELALDTDAPGLVADGDGRL